MEMFNQHLFNPQSKVSLAKAAIVTAALLSLVSCDSLGSADSPLNRTPANKAKESSSAGSSFVPKNAEGYPQTSTGNNAVDSIINQQLTDLVDQWTCPAQGESLFKIERHSLSAGYLSIQYSAMQLCSGMPSPNSIDSALTFSLTDGTKITLESLTQCNSIEQIGQKIGSSNLKARIEGCPAPQLSGNFFIDEHNISLLNFYPTHNDIGCEFEVVKTLSELMCH